MQMNAVGANTLLCTPVMHPYPIWRIHPACIPVTAISSANPIAVARTADLTGAAGHAARANQARNVCRTRPAAGGIVMERPAVPMVVAVPVVNVTPGQRASQVNAYPNTGVRPVGPDVRTVHAGTVCVTRKTIAVYGHGVVIAWHCVAMNAAGAKNANPSVRVRNAGRMGAAAFVVIAMQVTRAKTANA